MDSATHDLVYQRISELVYDEEKIVTPISIASESKITPKDAVTLLKEFISAHNMSKSGPLAVTYLLYGRLKDGNSITLSLVKDKDLKDKKFLFDEISTETIYSVQTGKEIDFKMIALTNSSCENRNSVLVSRNSVKRNIKVKKIPEVPVSTVKQNVVSPAPSSSDTTAKNGAANGKTQSQQKPKQNGLASFFAKAPPKAQTVKADSKVEKTSVEKVIKKEIVKTEDKITTSKTTVENKKSPEKNQEKQSPQDKKPHSEKSSNQSEQPNNKKRKKESTNKGPNKKRKRIQQICDSDSDDIFDDDQNEDIIEMSDEEPPPPPRVAKPPTPKNKKRKAVDKTYKDEEGFIVTTTEYVYETASEDEEPAKVAKSEEKVLSEKKNGKQNLPVEVKPAGKGKGNKKVVANGKQPTLMSFFKRN